MHQPGDLYGGSDLWPCFVYFPAVGFAVGQLCQCRPRPTFTMLLLGLLPLMLLRGCGCQAADVPEDVTAEFSVRLYHQLQIMGGEENIIFSPLSVALALGMVELGARGSSLEEIRQALGYSNFREDEEFSLLSNLTQALSTDEEQYVVRLANSLFLQRGVHFNEEFLQLMKKYFKAELETVDFSQSAAVAERINSWVLNHTESKIQNLVSTDDFSSSTMIMLVNAVYFRGSWKNQFRPENTRTFSFTKDDGSEVQTLMMYQQGDFYYGEFSDGTTEAGGAYQVLEMLYEGEDMSMMIVLPRQEVPLATLEPIIKAQLLEEWANNVKRQKIQGGTKDRSERHTAAAGHQEHLLQRCRSVSHDCRGERWTGSVYREGCAEGLPGGDGGRGRGGSRIRYDCIDEDAGALPTGYG
ncbi:neuroserpin isoform X4 [Siphateles boraxobius]|uniref:neuroserpin isoform X4 n=1 Tax=Siphateles boraxobius TaxID=180520 RepID=UPI0040637A31